MLSWSRTNLPNLLGFFQTGDLGDLRKTATIEDVHKLLGQPDTHRSSSSNFPGEDYLILEYGSLTVLFTGERLMQIDISIFDVPTILPDGLNVYWNKKGWVIRKSQIRTFLQKQGIDYKIFMPICEEPLESFWIEDSQVFVHFRTEGEEDPKIEHLVYTQDHVSDQYRRVGYTLIDPN